MGITAKAWDWFLQEIGNLTSNLSSRFWIWILYETQRSWLIDHGQKSSINVSLIQRLSHQHLSWRKMEWIGIQQTPIKNQPCISSFQQCLISLKTHEINERQKGHHIDISGKTSHRQRYFRKTSSSLASQKYQMRNDEQQFQWKWFLKPYSTAWSLSYIETIICW